LAAGFDSARGTLVANFDVDYYDLAFLDAALVLLEDDDVDIVLASKRAPGARDRRPLVRRLLTAVFAFVLRSMVDLKASDAHGMKVLRRASTAPIVDRCVMRRSLFDVEMVLRAANGGLGIREIPAVVVERRPPRTSLTRRSIESLIGLWKLRAILRREASSSPGPRGERHCS